MIVDDSISVNVVKKILDITNKRRIPIVGLVDDINNDFTKILSTAHIVQIITKPTTNKLITKTISDAIDLKIQKSFTQLQTMNKQALEESLDIFSHVPNIVRSNYPIKFEDIINRSCTIIETVDFCVDDEILLALKECDNYTVSHSFRVSILMSHFGLAMGLIPQDITILAAGGLLHDIGKYFIPFHILHKKEPLTNDDRIIIRSHISRGTHMLRKKSNIPNAIVVMMEQHHERLDGSGYPHGLVSSQISDIGKIAAIADIFCIMTDGQSYREKQSVDRTLMEMHSVPEKIDPYFLSILADIIMDNSR
ncbi:MAG: HD domain-containing protein [Emcibacter sp.]|nr:HD domain-containing protein [Emcibacter sp.]